MLRLFLFIAKIGAEESILWNGDNGDALFVCE